MYNFFPLKLYSVLAAKCYWHLSVNTFKTLDKTNKINTLLCRLNFYLLAYLSFFQQKCEQTEYIAGAGVCGIKPQIVSRRPLHHRSDFIYHVKRDDWQEEWGDTDKTMWKSFETKCIKAPVLMLTSESDINLSLGENSPRSTKWKVNKW